MIGQFFKFPLKTQKILFFEKIGTTPGLKDKNLPKFLENDNNFCFFFNYFDLSEKSEIQTPEKFVKSHDLLFSGFHHYQ